MKKLLPLVFVCLTIHVSAQNLATVSANNIADLAGNKLGSGQLCFLATDQNDNPISFQVGGGGQVIRRAFCSTVAAGVAASFTVPNPATTSPSGIFYRVTVKDSSTGQEVLRYTGVTFSGGTFGFDQGVRRVQEEPSGAGAEGGQRRSAGKRALPEAAAESGAGRPGSAMPKSARGWDGMRESADEGL
jgi:hypothetical protein